LDLNRKKPFNHPEFDFTKKPLPKKKAKVKELEQSVVDLASHDLKQQILAFREFGKDTICEVSRYEKSDGGKAEVPLYLNEFWTARQRQAHSLHEISYRACFKPQLPAFFIDRLTAKGDIVYDPFMGRGTTPLEAALKGRIPYGCDINPLSERLLLPRLTPPDLSEVQERLKSLIWDYKGNIPKELLVFYHPDTLRSICALRDYLIKRESKGKLDAIDAWIRLVAINRLTGHSAGFFSVYSLPPNQAVSVQSQKRINERRNQMPLPRDVPAIILKKSKSLLKDLTANENRNLHEVAVRSKMVIALADRTDSIASSSVSLVVTSPPFLDVVDYVTDNWLRCWFIGLDAKALNITMSGKLSVWEETMTRVFVELTRVLKPGGHIAFEVGEVRKGKMKLEDSVLRCGDQAGLIPLFVMVNAQQFTKTANCWGVDNNSKGTNSNRIVLFRKE
jgi:DNA modification methylase